MHARSMIPVLDVRVRYERSAAQPERRRDPRVELVQVFGHRVISPALGPANQPARNEMSQMLRSTVPCSSDSCLTDEFVQAVRELDVVGDHAAIARSRPTCWKPSQILSARNPRVFCGPYSK